MKIVVGECYIRKDGKVVQVVEPVFTSENTAYVTIKVILSVRNNFYNDDSAPFLLSCDYFAEKYTKLNVLQRTLLCD